MSLALEGKKIGKVYLEGKKLQQIWTEGNKIYDSRKSGEAAELGEMILVCNIPSANYKMDLSPWLAAAPGDGTTNIVVNWGDNSAEERYSVGETRGTDTIVHNYTNAGEYRITLKGEFNCGFDKLTTNTSSLQATLTSIELPSGKSPIKHVGTYAFYMCRKLTIIPKGLFDNCTAVERFDACFSECTQLTSIPQGLFDNCTAVTHFSSCFYKCSSLTIIPKGLFDNCTAVERFGFCFSDCTQLTSIPQGLFDNCTAVTDFSFCFCNCKSITSLLPTLWVSHSDAFPIDCFDYCDKAPNYIDAYGEGWAFAPVPAVPEMVLNIVSPSDGFIDFSYILGNDPERQYTRSATIDWGDGSREVEIVGNEYTTDKTKLQHTYSEKNKEYKITIKGKIKWSGGVEDHFATINTRQSIISIELITNSSPIQFITTHGFYRFTKLQSISEKLFNNCINVTDFSDCFYYCLSLQSIPKGLFDYNTEVTDFQACFDACTSLRSIPEGLFDNNTKVTGFRFCFDNCRAVTSKLPTLWISHPKADGYSCFYNCTKAANYTAAQNAGWA